MEFHSNLIMSVQLAINQPGSCNGLVSNIFIPKSKMAMLNYAYMQNVCIGKSQRTILF